MKTLSDNPRTDNPRADNPGSPPGLIMAAPASGSGKTLVTLSLLHHLRQTGHHVMAGKVGPDYIDSAFHTMVSGRPCLTLDPWAMRASSLAAAVALAEQEPTDLILVEGVMGLFDGAKNGSGSTADLAQKLGWPVILIVDVRGQAASVAALVHGFHSYRPGLQLAGVICNYVGSAHHAKQIQQSLSSLAVPLLGCIPRHPDLHLPDRHLGLIPAREHPNLTDFLDKAARQIAKAVAIPKLIAVARSIAHDSNSAQPSQKGSARSKTCAPSISGLNPPIPPLGQRIAVASDLAFQFTYPHILMGWRMAGVEIIPFSPLADEVPDCEADAIFIPGGYPELHAGKLSGSEIFRISMQKAAARNKVIYGECGGYMILGQFLIDAQHIAHPMLALLPISTSFADRRLCLGYRRLSLRTDNPLGAKGTTYRGHEFHYARELQEKPSMAASVFTVHDSAGETMSDAGCQKGTVFGSFLHLIDSEAE